MSKVVITFLITVLVAVAGCETKEQTGQVIGAAAGAAAGSQVGSGSGRTAAIVAGTLLGGWLGGRIGVRMDEDDEEYAERALEENETLETSTWENPDTGAEWAMTPTDTFERDDRPCREFETVVEADGDEDTLQGVACRTADGDWEVVES